MDTMGIFGIIMISVGIGIYGVYVACCIYYFGGPCCSKIIECMTCCCKSNQPLDQDLIILEQDIRLPLSMNLYETEMNSI